MENTFTYFNEEGVEAFVNYANLSEQVYLKGFTRGVKWKSPNGKDIYIVERNKLITLCPLISRPYLLFIFTDFFSYSTSDNRIAVYDYEGQLIKEINIVNQTLKVINDIQYEIKSSKCVHAFQEKLNDKHEVFCIIEYLVHWGWVHLYEKIIFNEVKLNLGNVVSIWKEP